MTTSRRTFLPAMISLKVPADWPDRLLVAADGQRMTRSDWIRGVISRALERAERKQQRHPKETPSS